jgi:hypothetical protein
LSSRSSRPISRAVRVEAGSHSIFGW